MIIMYDKNLKTINLSFRFLCMVLISIDILENEIREMVMKK